MCVPFPVGERVDVGAVLHQNLYRLHLVGSTGVMQRRISEPVPQIHIFNFFPNFRQISVLGRRPNSSFPAESSKIRRPIPIPRCPKKCRASFPTIPFPNPARLKSAPIPSPDENIPTFRNNFFRSFSPFLKCDFLSLFLKIAKSSLWKNEKN